MSGIVQGASDSLPGQSSVPPTRSAVDVGATAAGELKVSDGVVQARLVEVALALLREMRAFRMAYCEATGRTFQPASELDPGATQWP